MQTSFDAIRSQIEALEIQLVQVLADVNHKFDLQTPNLLRTSKNKNGQSVPPSRTNQNLPSDPRMEFFSGFDECDVAEKAPAGGLSPINAARHSSLSRS